MFIFYVCIYFYLIKFVICFFSFFFIFILYTGFFLVNEYKSTHSIYTVIGIKPKKRIYNGHIRSVTVT